MHPYLTALIIVAITVVLYFGIIALELFTQFAKDKDNNHSSLD